MTWENHITTPWCNRIPLWLDHIVTSWQDHITITWGHDKIPPWPLGVMTRSRHDDPMMRGKVHAMTRWRHDKVTPWIRTKWQGRSWSHDVMTRLHHSPIEDLTKSGNDPMKSWQKCMIAWNPVNQWVFVSSVREEASVYSADVDQFPPPPTSLEN
jgi:hypothetical protein